MSYPLLLNASPVYDAAYDAGYAAGEAAAAIFLLTYLAYFVILFLALSIIGIVMEWRLLARGGCHGWAVFIPIYNAYCLYKAIFGQGWLFLLNFVPIVNIGFVLVTPFFMAKAYGRNTFFFGLGLLFFPFIFMLILAFGEDLYCGPN